MQYLKGTQTLGLEFKRDKTIKNIENEQQLKAYFDASWGGWESHLETTMKSTSGYIITFMNTPISWGSTLQKGKPAQSSGESEYIAAYHGATELIYINNIAKFLRIIDTNKPLRCYSDSSACIGMSKNPINHKRNKHIMLKYHWVRISVENSEIALEYINTKEQPADILTKTIKTHIQFRHLRSKLLS